MMSFCIFWPAARRASWTAPTASTICTGSPPARAREPSLVQSLECAAQALVSVDAGVETRRRLEDPGQLAGSEDRRLQLEQRAGVVQGCRVQPPAQVLACRVLGRQGSTAGAQGHP